MSVLLVLITVLMRLLASTLLAATLVPVTGDTVEMESHVMVKNSILLHAEIVMSLSLRY